MYTCIYTSTHVSIYMYTCMHVYMCMYIYICISRALTQQSVWQWSWQQWCRAFAAACRQALCNSESSLHATPINKTKTSQNQNDTKPKRHKTAFHIFELTKTSPKKKQEIYQCACRTYQYFGIFVCLSMYLLQTRVCLCQQRF